MWTTGRKNFSLNAEHTKGRFTGYVVVVAGGCSGIGRASVERFANDGAIVYILDINVQGENDFMSTFGDRVKCIKLDITDAERCKETMKEIADQNGGFINTVVNTAAYFGSKGETATKQDWDRSFGVNVIGYSNVIQAALPYMASDNTASIVNLSSISAHRAQPVRWTYSATKGAVSSMTRCMALDLWDRKVRVNAVSPSWIWSPEVAKAANYDRDSAEAIWGKFHISDRVGEVEEVAAVVTFLASRDASYVNGADIPVCGGYLAIGPEQRGENSTFSGTKY